MPDQTSTPRGRRVVMTGAGGRIGRAVAGSLATRWDLVRTDRREAADGPAERTAWLSARDAAELVRAAVEADLPAGVDGFVVAHGVSANRHGVAELEQTRRSIGYAPVDDAWGTDG